MTRREILTWSYRGVKATDRFLKYATPDDPKKCWEWSGFRNPAGYGIMGVGPNLFIASRLAWIIGKGKIPHGLNVLHHSDNPPCCNLNHLFLGTHQDNSDDAIKKGRWKPAFGEDIGMSKLTEKQVVAIRFKYQKPGVTQSQLAAEYGVTENNIKHIVDYRSWVRAGGPKNTKDRYHNRRGEHCRDAKLTTKDVLKIRQLHADGMRAFEIKELYPVTRPVISGILNRRYWKHI